MSRKRKFMTGAKVTNWAASVPGMIQDWKDLGGKVGKAAKVAPPVTAAAGTAPLWSERVRAWLMDSAVWGDIVLVSIPIVVWIYAGVWMTRKIREAKEEGARAAVEARQDERTKLLTKRMTRGTARVSLDERVSPETAVTILNNPHEVAYVLVEQFIQRHPEHVQEDEDGKTELNREALLAWLVRSSNPLLPERKALKALEK